MKTYHVGLLASGHKAVFQYRRSVDYLSCEILEYYGTRESTKTSARARLAECKAVILASLNDRYPGRNFTTVIVD